MGGICGFISWHKPVESPARRREIIEEMAARMSHRGPGGVTYYLDQFAGLAQLLPHPTTGTGRSAEPAAPLDTTKQPVLEKRPSSLLSGQQHSAGIPLPPIVLFDGQVYNLSEIKRDFKPGVGYGQPPPTAISGPAPSPVAEIYPSIIDLYEQVGPMPAKLRGAAFTLGPPSALLLAGIVGIKPLYYAGRRHHDLRLGVQIHLAHP